MSLIFAAVQVGLSKRENKECIPCSRIGKKWIKPISRAAELLEFCQGILVLGRQAKKTKDLIIELWRILEKPREKKTGAFQGMPGS